MANQADNANKDNPKIDVNKVFDAIARIMGDRYNADIKVVSVRKRDGTKEDTA